MIKKFEDFKDDFYQRISYFDDFENTIDISSVDFEKIINLFPNWECLIDIDDGHERIKLYDRSTVSPIGKETGLRTILFIYSIIDDYYGVTYWTGGDGEINKSVCDQFDGLVKFLYDEKLIYREQCQPYL